MAGLDVEGGELDVEAGLLGLEGDGVLEGVDGAGGVVRVFEDAAEDGPGLPFAGWRVVALRSWAAASAYLPCCMKMMPRV